MSDTISVLVIAPNTPPVLQTIDHNLGTLQKMVGGSIEAIYPFDEPVAIICNEEGKLMGLPFNRCLRDETGKIYDIICGTFLIAGLGQEDFTSLPEKFVNQFTQRFSQPERFIPIGNQLVVYPMDSSETKK